MSKLVLSLSVKSCVCFIPIEKPSYYLFDLMRARTFNQVVAPALKHASYKQFRQSMDNYGLSYKSTSCTVGHCIPVSKGGSNYGFNLFAQFEQDNQKLRSKKVSCGELFHYYRTGPPCTCHNIDGSIEDECPLWMEN